MKNLVERDYAVYSGVMLEKYFAEQFIASHRFSSIGSYWEKGNQNEIDIVAINDFEKQLVFVEVKRKKENISIPVLQEKASALVQQFANYMLTYQALSIQDM